MDVLERAKKQRENMKHNHYLTAFRSAKFWYDTFTNIKI
jgi:hypothetical protein